ncbi:MAG: NAD-dependent succinate-semialdehyde dehydrogenase [Nitrospirae bacterium]|nr:MAG: NAD-dependent succinate-semialdehyde dehydrogenase [Nitrospirota bacterium]
MAIESLNPATGELLERFEAMAPEAVEAAVAATFAAWRAWRDTDFATRAERMREAARLLRRDAERHARTMTEEMGKPIREARAEVEKCAWVCDYYAETAADHLAPEPGESDGSKAYVRFDPLGPVLAVMPWNFPYWQVFRFAAPALMAGNAGLLKHASNVPRCALAIEALFREAGFPEDLFRTLLVGADQVGAVIDDPRVAAVTLTGSEPAGRQVAARAGSALKKTVLELGGSDPFVVLEDAELDTCCAVATTARCLNSGQSCIAAKRFIVVEAVYDRFLEAFTDRMRALRVGDPLDEATEVGPLARADLRDELHEQVVRSVERGARVVTGGTVPEGPGAFYPPTVLVEVGPGQPAYEEELFGPVAAVIRARDEAEAVAIANDTRFGLGASLWTADVERGERLAARIEAGSVFVNGMVKSDPRLPFGGVKASGYGRELARFGIREFVNVKTVWVA